MKKNFLAVLFALALCSPTFAQWKPAGDKIKTPWGEQLNPKNVLPEYPRPIMERQDWKNLNGSCAEIIGVAAYEQCEKFVETLDKYQQFTDIRNVGAAVHSMIDAANEKMDDAGFDPDMDWTYLAKVFGSAAIPVESAEVIKKALKKAEKDGTITSKNKWQMIEYWAADYLAGK